MNKEYEIYYEAYDIEDAEERRKFILEKCGGDQKFFDNIMKLFPETPLDEDVYGKYEIEKEIGRGGMGIVYLASYTEKFESESFTKKVALKTISPEQTLDTKSIKKLLLEIKTVAELEHANIARFLDIGTSEKGKPFFVMEFIDGLPVTEYCDKNKLSVRERLEFFRQILGAIEYSHRRGFIHCDIKPNNILVDSNGTPKIIDFGIASKYGTFISDKNFHTTFFQNAFTVNYASPEQIKGEKNLTEATDIYSLGVVLYELLSGQLPIDFAETASYQQLINTSETRQPPNLKKSITNIYSDDERAKIAAERDCQTPSELKENLPNDLDEIVQTAIAKKPSKRYKSIKDFDVEIEDFLHEDSVLSQLKRAFSALYRKISRRVKRVPMKWAFASVLGLIILSGVLSQFGTIRTIPYYLQLRFSDNPQKITISDSQKRFLDNSIAELKETLPQNLNDASQELRAGKFSAAHNVWGLADLVNALESVDYPLNKSELDATFDQYATPEGCWKEEKFDCKLAVSAWVMFSKNIFGEPLTDGQIEFILRNQSEEGWFPSFPYPERKENAAIYPTAMVSLALTKHLESNLINEKYREKVKKSVEKGVKWILAVRRKDKKYQWNDCPNAPADSQTRSYGLDGTVIYLLHTIEKSNLFQIENFSAELKEIDSEWFDNLQTMPAFDLEETSASRCGVFDGNELIYDRTNFGAIPWSIAATVEGFPNGTFWQKAAARRWLENLPLSQTHRGHYYSQSEYLIALSLLRENIP